MNPFLSHPHSPLPLLTHLLAWVLAAILVLAWLGFWLTPAF